MSGNAESLLSHDSRDSAFPLIMTSGALHYYGTIAEILYFTHSDLWGLTLLSHDSLVPSLDLSGGVVTSSAASFLCCAQLNCFHTKKDRGIPSS